jgi:beta-galactosidase
LIGPRSGSKTGVFTIPANLAPDLPRNMLDAKVARVDSMNPSHKIAVKGGGDVRLWRERLETRARVEMEDEEGVPVLVSQGKLFYRSASGDKALMQRIIDRMVDEAEIKTIPLPAGVRCRTRDGFRVYVNYGASAATLTLAEDEVAYVLGSETILGAGVTVAKLAKSG